MKKLFLPLSFPFLSLLPCANAQLSLGLKSNLTHAQMQYAEGDYVEGVDLSIWTLGGGFSGEYRITQYFSAKLEANLAQRGSRCMPYVNLPVGANDVKLVTRYVAIPVLLKFDYPIWKDRLRLYAESGASYNWMFNATRYFYGEDGRISSHNRVGFDNWDNLNRRDFALEFGGGLAIPVGKNQILLGSRYVHGLKNVSWFKSLNRAWEFSIGAQIAVP